jgi:hypothetical protein
MIYDGGIASLQSPQSEKLQDVIPIAAFTPLFFLL